MNLLTSQEQVAPALGVESAESEADENHWGSHESCHDDAAERKQRHIHRITFTYPFNENQIEWRKSESLRRQVQSKVAIKEEREQ